MSLTKKEINEINQMTTADLNAVIRIMGWQVRAPIFVGDRNRSIEIRATAIAEFTKRGGVIV